MVRVSTAIQRLIDEHISIVDIVRRASAINLCIYSGAQPISANNMATGTLLITIPITRVNYNHDGRVGFICAPTGICNTGLAGWWRLLLGNDGNPVGTIDGSCGMARADLNMSSLYMPASTIFNFQFNLDIPYLLDPDDLPSYTILDVQEWDYVNDCVDTDIGRITRIPKSPNEGLIW